MLTTTNGGLDTVRSARDQTGVVVWLTGRPSSGKSTLASMAQSELVRSGHHCVVLDGDAVRAAIVPPHGYSSEGRDAFYFTLARLAAMLCEQGLVVLVPATAHRAVYRSRARELARSFVEVYVDTPASECQLRDDKGLYARAGAGELDDLPGSTIAFEEPSSPDLIAHGGRDAAAVARILDLVLRVAT